MSNKEEAAKIGQFIIDKSKVALFEAVTEALHRQPEANEWAIAVSSFLMGSCCAAEALIDGLNEFHVARN